MCIEQRCYCRVWLSVGYSLNYEREVKTLKAEKQNRLKMICQLIREEKNMENQHSRPEVSGTEARLKVGCAARH